MNQVIQDQTLEYIIMQKRILSHVENRQKIKQLYRDKGIQMLDKPEQVQVIKEKLFKWAITNENLCKYVSEGIIEKAITTEISQSPFYAQLCKYIIKESKKLQNEAQQQQFKSHLYNNIQSIFEGKKDIFKLTMNFSYQEKPENMQSNNKKNLYFIEKKKREKQLIIFIGYLFAQEVMNFCILDICMGTLLSRFINGYCEASELVKEAHYEYHLENLIALFEQKQIVKKIVEKYLNKFKFKSSYYNNLTYIISILEQKKLDKDIDDIYLSLEDYFTIFEWLNKNKKISPKIQSMITNLLEEMMNLLNNLDYQKFQTKKNN
ncbi:hypothetical protein ABPG72_020519 [Tetrahymena utriculariae]